MLGVIAMFGIIMRNSVILVDQIEQDIAAGHKRFDAIVGATVRRFRPIMLTAAAAVLRADSALAQQLLRPDGDRPDGRHHERHRHSRCSTCPRSMRRRSAWSTTNATAAAANPAARRTGVRS